MKKLVVCLVAAVLALCALSTVCLAMEYDVSFDTSSKGVYIVNLDTGVTVYAAGENEPYPTASTVKLLTALVALDQCEDPENTVVTVTNNLWNLLSRWSGMSLSGIKPGEQIKMVDLLACMLIPSGCEAAAAVAANYGYADFIDLMNKKLADLGANDSHVSNPHGLYADDQYVTAHDMSLIAREVLKHPLLVEICGKSRYNLPATNMNSARTVASSNLMMDTTTRYYWSCVTGLKTGVTTQGGRNYVLTVQRNGVHYLAVFLSADKWTDGKWSDGYGTFNDAYACLNWCFNNLSLTRDVNTDLSVAQITVRASADKDYILLYPQDDLVLLTQKGVTRNVTYECSLPERIYAPVTAGQVIGTARVLVNGEDVGEITLVSREDVKRSLFVAFIDRVSDLVATKGARIVIGALLLLAIAYVVIVRRYATRSRKARAKGRKK